MAARDGTMQVAGGWCGTRSPAMDGPAVVR
jgi:hypothetical protein